MSGEAYYGELKDGFVIDVNQEVVWYLLRDDCHLLHQIGERFEFEINVGFNRKVWVSSPSMHNLVCLIKCIQLADNFVDADEKTVAEFISGSFTSA